MSWILFDNFIKIKKYILLNPNSIENFMAFGIPIIQIEGNNNCFIFNFT